MEHSFKDYTEFPLSNDEPVTKFNCDSGFNFIVDDKLDCPKEKDMMTNEFPGSLTASSGQTSANTAVDSCKSSLSGGHFNDNVSINESHFSGDELCVPYDDLAELEWLSNFVEESYSTDDLHLFIPNTAANSTRHPPLLFPTRARSKRSRAAPCGWSTPLLLHVSRPSRRREPSGRKCLHCASEKTPQWRTGPMGPKTLCNACGVRFKSGRLVPEYRPASSPTFIYSKHSNSHRKVLELRRQKTSLSSNIS